MWFDEAGEVAEMFRSSFPLSLLFFVPIFILISPIRPTSAAHEFTVFRMQQYDLQGAPYGCRNSLVNVEARVMDSASVTRRCVLGRLSEVTAHRVKQLASQNAGALLILLPTDLARLSAAHRDHLYDLEAELLADSTHMPVYMVHESEEITSIYDHVASASAGEDAGSAAAALVAALHANGFQMVVGGSQSKAMPEFQVANLEARLAGAGLEDSLPTIVVVAHYDAGGLAPSLAYGADSNGSGVAALLELVRLFSRLYSSSRTHAKANIIFLLSGAGKYNYQGSKRWLEEALDSGEATTVTDAAFVLCLDALASGDSLHLHVSKPPKEGSAGHGLMMALESVMGWLSPQTKFSVVHKKINLGEEVLAWEHERFSIRRLPAFTLSHHGSHRVAGRSSVADVRSTVSLPTLHRNIAALAEALARFVYQLPTNSTSSIFSDGLQVEVESLSAWMDYLGSEPRAAQLLHKDSAVLHTLQQALRTHVREVRSTWFTADARDPDFVLYDTAEAMLSAYSVKPAVFDLALALAIAAYLGALYLLASRAPALWAARPRGPATPLGRQAANGKHKTQ